MLVFQDKTYMWHKCDTSCNICVCYDVKYTFFQLWSIYQLFSFSSGHRNNRMWLTGSCIITAKYILSFHLAIGIFSMFRSTLKLKIRAKLPNNLNKIKLIKMTITNTNFVIWIYKSEDRELYQKQTLYSIKVLAFGCT